MSKIQTIDPTTLGPEDLGIWNKVKENVVAITVEKLELLEEKEVADPTSSFIHDLGADSLDFCELILEFEKAFEMAIPDTDAEKIKTVGQAVSYIYSAKNPALK